MLGYEDVDSVEEIVDYGGSNLWELSTFFLSKENFWEVLNHLRAFNGLERSVEPITLSQDEMIVLVYGFNPSTEKNLGISFLFNSEGSLGMLTPHGKFSFLFFLVGALRPY